MRLKPSLSVTVDRNKTCRAVHALCRLPEKTLPLQKHRHLGKNAIDAWLAELRRLPVDVLKVDGLVVQGLHRARADRDLVRLAVGLADALGVEAVAEGVERVDTLLALGELGYRSAQGTILTPPLPPEAISRILADGGHVTLP